MWNLKCSGSLINLLQCVVVTDVTQAQKRVSCVGFCVTKWWHTALKVKFTFFSHNILDSWLVGRWRWLWFVPQTFLVLLFHCSQPLSLTVNINTTCARGLQGHFRKQLKIRWMGNKSLVKIRRCGPFFCRSLGYQFFRMQPVWKKLQIFIYLIHYFTVAALYIHNPGWSGGVSYRGVLGPHGEKTKIQKLWE